MTEEGGDDMELKNCALCGSDKVGIIRITEQSPFLNSGFCVCDMEILCTNCQTRFCLHGNSREEVLNLWNGNDITSGDTDR